MASASASAASESLSILSPFDEKEEWHKISEILNSFGSNIGKDVKESTTPHNCKYNDLKWAPHVNCSILYTMHKMAPEDTKNA